MRTRVIKPAHLEEGDTIAVVSPCGGAARAFPYILRNGIKNIKDLLNVNIKEYPTTRMSREYLHMHPERRAKDVNDAFDDPDVKAIICSIGGDGDSIRVMKYIDIDAALSNPKIFMGLSDPTTIITLLNQSGLVTFYGPTVMAGLSQMKSLPDTFSKHVRTMLMNPGPRFDYVPYSTYSSGYPEWADKKNIGKVKEPKRNSGWHWIQGDGIVRGRLFGGCADMFEMYKGSEFWPSTNFFRDRVFFLDTSEVNPPTQFVKSWIRNYGIMGVLDEISALLVSIPYNYTPAQERDYERMLVDVVSKEYGRDDLPVVTHMDFGHTDPKFILPLGIGAELNCDNKTFRLTEQPLL